MSSFAAALVVAAGVSSAPASASAASHPSGFPPGWNKLVTRVTPALCRVMCLARSTSQSNHPTALFDTWCTVCLARWWQAETPPMASTHYEHGRVIQLVFVHDPVPSRRPLPRLAACIDSLTTPQRAAWRGPPASRNSFTPAGNDAAALATLPASGGFPVIFRALLFGSCDEGAMYMCFDCLRLTMLNALRCARHRAPPLAATGLAILECLWRASVAGQHENGDRCHDSQLRT